MKCVRGRSEGLLLIFTSSAINFTTSLDLHSRALRGILLFFQFVFKSAKHFWDDNKVSQSRNTSGRYTMSSKIHKQNGNLIWMSRIRGDNVNQLFSLSTTRWKPSQSQCDKEKKIFKPSAIESLSNTERQCCGKL